MTPLSYKRFSANYYRAHAIKQAAANKPAETLQRNKNQNLYKQLFL